MNNQKTVQILNILGLIAVIAINTLAVILPIAGRSTGEISDYYPNLFVPAGYAFSIWSVIYILLIIFIVLQAKGLFKSDQPAPAFVELIGPWFLISCIANCGWILAWHYLLTSFSVLLMLLLLGSLIMIYLRLNNQIEVKVPFFAKLTFSVYLGWITVATVANVTALLVSLNWTGFGFSEITWTVIMILAATAIASVVIWNRKDIGYTAVIIWAFIAIVVKRQMIANPDEGIIITSIYIAIAIMAALLLFKYLRPAKN